MAFYLHFWKQVKRGKMAKNHKKECRMVSCEAYEAFRELLWDTQFCPSSFSELLDSGSVGDSKATFLSSMSHSCEQDVNYIIPKCLSMHSVLWHFSLLLPVRVIVFSFWVFFTLSAEFLLVRSRRLFFFMIIIISFVLSSVGLSDLNCL